MYLLVNLDTEEYLDPKRFGHPSDFPTIANSSGGVLFGLSLLLLDHGVESPAGTWAGSRVVLADESAKGTRFLDLIPNLQKRIAKLPVKKLRAARYYPEGSDLPDPKFFKTTNLFAIARLLYRDISEVLVEFVGTNDHNHRLARVDPKTGRVLAGKEETAILQSIEQLKTDLRTGQRADAILDLMKLRVHLDAFDEALKVKV